MSFWSSSSSKSSANPKRSFQWIGIVNLYSSPTEEALGALAQNFDTFTTPGIKPFLIKSFSKPRYTVPVGQVKDGMTPSITHVTGTPQWEDIKIVAYDVYNVANNATKILYNFLEKNGYSSGVEIGKTDPLETNGMLRKLSNGDKINLTLQLIGTNGKPVEEWRMLKPVLQEFSFGEDLSYDSDEISTISMTFKISGAEYKYKGKLS